MFSKALKIVGLIGGGILALGTGSLGGHFAQPHLESVFNPQRKEREDRLQESLEEAQDEIEILNRGLSESFQTGELQSSSIKHLESEAEKLQGQINAKIKELDEKEKSLASKDEEIKNQKKLNDAQTTKISELNQQILTKTTELSEETGKKKKIEDELDGINKKLLLTRDDILTEKAIKESSLKINIRKFKRQSAEGGIATFEIVNYKNETKTIRVKKDGLTNHEQKAKEIRQQGINYGLNDDFDQWKKVIHIERYDLDYDYQPTEESKKTNFIVDSKTTTKDINIGDYFQSSYLKDAFKVFTAIVYLDVFPLCHNWSDTSSNKPYLFCDSKNVTQKFVEKEILTWPLFKNTDESKQKFDAYLYSFVSIEDFISYWTKKTVEFVRTGILDLFDFLSPIVIGKNYQSS